MKRRLSILILAVLGLSFLAGCSSTPSKQGAAGADVSQSGGTGGSGGASTSGAGGHGAWTGNPLDNPDSPLSTRTIYFDFDSSEIKPEFVDVLRAHARYLASNPNVKVTLEGHTDERGSREYNLALGERRAAQVKQFMMAEGVSASQLNTISYGEERPVDPGTGEAAWAHNRRVEIVY
jgi:peptidoglycan-associated lipoprotein